jgi:hypothetical protein
MEFRHRLLAAQQLMIDIQMVEQPHQLLPLATQELSELLAEMLRLCPQKPRPTTFSAACFSAYRRLDLLTVSGLT